MALQATALCMRLFISSLKSISNSSLPISLALKEYLGILPGQHSFTFLYDYPHDDNAGILFSVAPEIKTVSQNSLCLNGRLVNLMPFFEIERNDKRKIKEALSKPSYKNQRVLSV
ncbi:unnamed protein product [Mucor circinelloides]